MKGHIGPLVFGMWFDARRANEVQQRWNKSLNGIVVMGLLRLSGTQRKIPLKSENGLQLLEAKIRYRRMEGGDLPEVEKETKEEGAEGMKMKSARNNKNVWNKRGGAGVEGAWEPVAWNAQIEQSSCPSRPSS